jgi:HK97 family phage major capsid protein
METSEQLLSSISGEVKNLSSDAQRRFNELATRTLNLEQRFDSHKFSGMGYGADISVGQKVIESEGFKALQAGAPRTGKIAIEPEMLKTALINATGQNQPLVPADRVGIVPPVQRRLRLRNVLPVSGTSSNSFEFPKETSFTNNAAPQYSAGAYEGVAKAESALAFSLTSLPVSTIAHWIPVSRQLLDDAPAIQGYVNNRLLFGLKLKEENQLLNGSGVQGNLSGLITNSTAFDTNYTNTSTDNYLDVIRHASLQLQVADLNPDVVVLNPIDFDTAVGTKTSSTNDYVWANPAFLPTGEIWGMRPVITNSISQGSFLVLDSFAACMIFDRAGATVEISREHSDYFTRNLAAILVEERLCLAIFNTNAVLFGGFPFGS